MKKLRLISAILSIVMILGILANLSVLPVFADESETGAVKGKNPEYYRENFLTKNFSKPEDKIKTMTKMLENDKYIFYVQEETAEWCLENKLTGQYLFSNPYGIGGLTKASDGTREMLLSQVLIDYSDSGVKKSYTSYKDCVTLGQIKIRNLKNGIRVEYSIGNE